jgi:hypothetical protein
MNEAFLDCYIWDVNRYPRYGSITAKLNKRTLSDVFHHNSLSDSFQNNNVSIQIPDFLLNATQEQKEFVYKYKERIIRLKLPIMVVEKTVNGEERWGLDLRCAEHLKYLRN